MTASAAVVICCQRACELVTTPGETGTTARLLPFSVDGLIWAAWRYEPPRCRNHLHEAR
jgi:hypothetical protein